jgi:hypothetical protein
MEDIIQEEAKRKVDMTCRECHRCALRNDRIQQVVGVASKFPTITAITAEAMTTATKKKYGKGELIVILTTGLEALQLAKQVQPTTLTRGATISLISQGVITSQDQQHKRQSSS